MKQKTKKILAMVLLVCILITLPIRPMEAKAESGDREYEYTYDGYSVSYSIINEWNGGIQAEVSVKNTSDEAVKNWGIDFDAGGTVVNIWNACVKTNDGTWYIIKNSTYNSEIPAGGSASVGFIGVKEAGTQVVFDGYELTEIVAYSGDGSNGSAEDVTEPSTEASGENGTEEGFGGDGNSTPGNSETEAASDASCESTESGTQEIITGEMTTEESTVESVIDYTRDSDGDGLFDYLEAEYGCDSGNPDSDGDGLPDGYIEPDSV